jgi:predicted kinase
MELILFTGIQGSGKSQFYRERFSLTHVRINMDMLRTRHREELILNACLAGQTRAVVDNTNVTREQRARYIAAAKAAKFRVIGYYFSCRVADAIKRNSARTGEARVPDVAIFGTAARLELPRRDEGFDELYFVRIAENDQFIVEEWKDEV